MRYSKVVDGPLRVSRRVEHPTLDGGSVIQHLGVRESCTYRFYWITREDFQQELSVLEAMAEQGWVIDGDPAVTPVMEPLDLYNVVVRMHRLVPS
jgi:hypothetical protein